MARLGIEHPDMLANLDKLYMDKVITLSDKSLLAKFGLEEDNN
jgi:hypothetical protein